MVLVLAITGMPYSGKTEAARVAEERGVKVVNMGDVVREEARRRGLEETRENLERLMVELRERMGMGAIAKLCLEKLRGEKLVVVDGVRCLEEVAEFSKAGPVIVVAIHASPRTRYVRALRRGRRDDVRSWEEFVKRDVAELNVGLGNVIALADGVVVNEGNLEELREKMRQILDIVEELAEEA